MEAAVGAMVLLLPLLPLRHLPTEDTVTEHPLLPLPMEELTDVGTLSSELRL